MKWSLFAVLIGFGIDLLVGDPRSIPHPVVWIGKLISRLEIMLRQKFGKEPKQERIAGMLLWLITVILSALIPALILWGCHLISPWLRLIVESIMCWQILAAKSLRDESMKVYHALVRGNVKRARHALSMIVGRDTDRLDEDGITRAAVETVAENTSDGVIAPLFCLAILGAPFGFFYKAVNTMDSMLGYIDPPYTHFGWFPAKADDVMNFLPARISAMLMLAAGAILRMNTANGWKIFRRDRYKHASPNSAQTESMCAGLLEVQLAGDAWYKGVLHRKPFIGDPVRPVTPSDIPASCRLMYVTAVLALILFCAIKALILYLPA